MEWIMYIPGILLVVVVASYVSFLWIQGIDTMNTLYPDYKGEDFLDEDPKDNQ
jgi:hypothetical protein